MNSKPNQEMERWRSYWEKGPEQVTDVHEIIRGIPELLSKESEDFLTNKLVSALRLQQTDTLVDAGCGVGEFVLLLGHRCQRIIGIDYANSLLNIASKRCMSEGIAPMLICASVTNIPLKDSIADKGICMSVLEFIPEEMWKDTIEEFHRVTRDKGIVVLWCKNNFTFMNLYQRGWGLLGGICRVLRRQKWQSISDTEYPVGYYKSYRFYRKLFKETLGNIEEEWSFAVFSWRMLKRFKLNKIVERFELFGS